MNILIISECNKSALIETRRIVDQFAERKGERSWQTAITQQGLNTLRRLLRKTAKRNTAIACHWIKGSNRTELLWIVGNIRRFNIEGVVPTNMTVRDILRSKDENLWHTVEDISLLAGIAGLFHDFGKANILFQKKLDPPKTGKRILQEPCRHEWVSLRLFEAFVGGESDQDWLERLANISSEDEPAVLSKLIKDSPKLKNNRHPFATLPPLAKVIGWLIVSHHRLPKFTNNENFPPAQYVDIWLTEILDNTWNSLPKSPNEKQWEDVWKFPKCGTPFRSRTWQHNARQLAASALKRKSMQADWLQQDRFSSHLARLVLMLSDHYYSSGMGKIIWRDKNYSAYANTDRKTEQLKQKLDEHNIGVGHNAMRIARTLPELRQTLPSITRHKGFKKRSSSEKFRWQDKAYDLACAVRDRSATHGFFGINMASTGCGKTFANGKIMYGLADEKLGCRFSVALGLRTLTLQTGDALRNRLGLGQDDLAVLIGSQAVQELHENGKKPQHQNDVYEASGSESAANFFAEHQYVRYEGSLDDGRLSHWLKQSPKLHQLVSAPILVSTIDHLIPATEGERGGKQIAPMLRLLTADLVLDEPDDFDLSDLPALARLVNWAAMLGARVLLSSATLPPSLVETLFEAYAAGRKIYQAAVGEPNLPVNICCAWFDEYAVKQSDHHLKSNFIEAHTDFVQRRVIQIRRAAPLRQAKLLPIPIDNSGDVTTVIAAIAHTLSAATIKLHQAHHQQNKEMNKRVSIGLLRMANINPMIAVAKQFLESCSLPPNYRLHYCIYHSQYPLLVRSHIEKQLDSALMRTTSKMPWEVESIQQALTKYSEENHIFIVFGTSVTEVGRDHDYDWAIAEPSSMRSLIQLAGRIQRHRQQIPNTENMLIWNKNYRALTNQSVAYHQPGFESELFKLSSHDLNEIMRVEELQPVNAIPRIQEREFGDAAKNLVDLEHQHLRAKLFGSAKIINHASLWWEKPLDWSFELQRRLPFRASQRQEQYLLYFTDEGDEPEFCVFDELGNIKKNDSLFKRPQQKPLAERVTQWFDYDFHSLVVTLAANKEMEIGQICKKFAEINLRASEDQAEWSYQAELGVFNTLK